MKLPTICPILLVLLLPLCAKAGGCPSIATTTPTTFTKSLSQGGVTPIPLVREMLKLAEVGPSDVVFDLGSGDGRIPIVAAEEFGACGVGVEIVGQFVAASIKEAQGRSLNRVQFVHADFMDVDLSKATVVTLYLQPSGVSALAGRLRFDLKPGTRIVARGYTELPGFPEWKPAKILTVGVHRLVLFVVPEERK